MDKTFEDLSTIERRNKYNQYAYDKAKAQLIRQELIDEPVYKPHEYNELSQSSILSLIKKMQSNANYYNTLSKHFIYDDSPQANFAKVVTSYTAVIDMIRKMVFLYEEIINILNDVIISNLSKLSRKDIKIIKKNYDILHNKSNDFFKKIHLDIRADGNHQVIISQQILTTVDKARLVAESIIQLYEYQQTVNEYLNSIVKRGAVIGQGVKIPRKYM